MIIPESTKHTIKAILLYQTFSISSLAKKIGVNRSTIYSILKNKTASPVVHRRLLRFYIELHHQEGAC